MPRLSLGLGLVAALLATGPARAEGNAGPYLAGRIASAHSDYAEAARYYTMALGYDTSNVELLENAIIAQVAAGAVDRALPIVTRLEDLDPGSQVAALVTLADLARSGGFEEALAALKDGKTGGPLVDGLYKAWALLGQGQMSEAAGAFDEVTKSNGLRAFGLYHKALALASVGDYEGADKILSGAADGPLRATRRGIIAHAQILSQLERNADAIELLTKITASAADPALEDMLKALEAGQVLPFTVVTTPADGIAEVYYTVGSALNGDKADINTLLFARLAEFLRPGNIDATLLVAGSLEAQGQYDLANDAYNRVPRDAPEFLTAELGRAEALTAGGRVEAAIEVLEQLAKAHPENAVIWVTLGDTLRREERFKDAVRAYDKAVATFKEPREPQWLVYYARGISEERSKDWPAAEADFRKALELRPDQPQVLNYLGYSYLEMKTNLDEALAMIEKAVEQRPEDGYIQDSLGWGLYRLGRYDEAVDPMEKAVALTPVDPIVNDHLGDVYWAVGRQREAEFQWSRALSFKPATEEDAARIRRKLEVGLDEVLKEEGAQPLAVSKNGN